MAANIPTTNYEDFIKRSINIENKVFTRNKIIEIFDYLLKLKNDFTLKEQEYSDILVEISGEKDFYSGSSKDEFLKIFDNNNRIKNIMLRVQLVAPKHTDNTIRAQIYLLLDRSTDSIFHVFSTDETWVTGIYTKFNEFLQNVPKGYIKIRNGILTLAIQLIAVFVGIVFSIFAAQNLHPYIDMEYSEIYLFVIFLLLFSNIWTYIGNVITGMLELHYPIVDIRQKTKKSWGLKIFYFFILTILTWAVNYLLDFLLLTGK